MRHIYMTQQNGVDKCSDYNILALYNQDVEERKRARRLRKKTNHHFPVRKRKRAANELAHMQFQNANVELSRT